MFFLSDWRAARGGDRRVLKGWLWHIPALMPVAWWFLAVADDAALGLCGRRLCSAEPAAHPHFSGSTARDELARNRSVVIEDRGPLSWLFLNNNLHKVHHMHPRVPWYRLPKLYAANPQRYLSRNGGYRYASYAEIFPPSPATWKRPGRASVVAAGIALARFCRDVPIAQGWTLGFRSRWLLPPPRPFAICCKGI